MLCEKITLTGTGKILAVNTDGIEVKVPNDKLDQIRTIVKNWEKLTNLILEEDTYSRLWYRDINNYIAEFVNGEVYTKGAYEWDGRAIHKDTSMLVVPRAVQEYFINGTPVSKTLRESTNIFEFCLSMRGMKDSTFYMQSLESDDVNNHIIVETKLQRTNRLLVTNDGGLLIKRFAKGSITRMRNPYKMTVVNVIKPDTTPSMFNINYNFYEIECFKLIQGIEFKQSELFN